MECKSLRIPAAVIILEYPDVVTIAAMEYYQYPV